MRASLHLWIALSIAANARTKRVDTMGTRTAVKSMDEHSVVSNLTLAILAHTQEPPKQLTKGSRVIKQSKLFYRGTADFIVDDWRDSGGQAHIYDFRLPVKGSYKKKVGKVLRQSKLDKENKYSRIEASIMKLLAGESKDDRIDHLAVCEPPFHGRVIEKEGGDYLFSFCNDGGSMSLAQYLLNNQTTPLQHWIDVVKDITSQLLEAVSLLADQHIVHGDVKPLNVLVKPATKTSPDTYSVCDFGAARILPRGKASFIDTSPSAFSALYAAPEQSQALPAMGMHLNTDVFSVGLITFTLLAKKYCNPFERKSEQIDFTADLKKALLRKHADAIQDAFGFEDSDTNMKELAAAEAKKWFDRKYGMKYVYAMGEVSKMSDAEVKRLLKKELLVCQPGYEELTGNRVLAQILQLLVQMLRFNPQSRVSARDALGYLHTPLKP